MGKRRAKLLSSVPFAFGVSEGCFNCVDWFSQVKTEEDDDGVNRNGTRFLVWDIYVSLLDFVMTRGVLHRILFSRKNLFLT